MDCETLVPANIWQFRLAAVQKSVVVCRGDLKMHIWESLLWEIGRIPDVPAEVRVPKQQLSDFEHGRQVVADLFPLSDGLPTISQMKKDVNAKFKDLVGLDRSFVLDLAFLQEKVEPIAVAQLEGSILAALPEKDLPISPTDTMLRLERLKSARLTTALGGKGQKNLSSKQPTEQCNE